MVRAKKGNGKETRKPTLTKLGYPLDQVASALQKEIRKGDIEAATFWGLLLFRTSPVYGWKRVLTTASEDIGEAAPDVVAQVAALNWAYRAAKEGAWYASPHPFTLAIVLLCRSPKSTFVEDLQSWQLERIRAGIRLPIPDYALDRHTTLGKERGAQWADWYRFRHVTCKIPVNAFTKLLWKLKPEWAPAELLADPSPSEAGEREP